MGYLRHARTYDRSETRDRLQVRAYGDGVPIEPKQDPYNGVTQTDRNVCRCFRDHRKGNRVRGRRGKGEQVTEMPTGEVREMRTAETVLSIIHERGCRPTRQSVQEQVTGEPRETETLMRGSERGRQKSASTS